MDQNQYEVDSIPLYKVFRSPLTAQEMNQFIKEIARKTFGHENVRQQCVKVLNEAHKKWFIEGRTSVKKVCLDIRSSSDEYLMIQLKTSDYDGSWVGWQYCIGDISGISLTSVQTKIQNNLIWKTLMKIFSAVSSQMIEEGTKKLMIKYLDSEKKDSDKKDG